ncbi:MAG: nucleoside monophosphate kinase [bacterium]|nr:nucleoside monophosphate kinase [bacterium]MDZ4284630.1 nucleoside monophosphate kinase [Patescibacteria group bacterium]
MPPRTILFYGRSGCGKGTQAGLLAERLGESGGAVLMVETGKLFREFMERKNFTSSLTKALLAKGGLLPEFLPVWIWTQIIIDRFSGAEHLVLDGLARRSAESEVLDGALRFYERLPADIVMINVSREWSFTRLKGRGRYDDTDADINRRLDWYEEIVVPAVAFFRNKPGYRFHEINGEQAIEAVEREITEALALGA